MFIRLLRYFILLLALLISGSAFSQLADTVVVYEYVYITDTVWKEAPARDTIIISPLSPIENATLIIDTTSKKADLVIFSSSASATIPINCIILSDQQQNLQSMKKITFLGLAFLALNTASYAQKPSDLFGIYFKGNLATQMSNTFDDKDKCNLQERFLPTIGFGVKYEKNLNKTFSVVSNLGYLQRGCYHSSWERNYNNYVNGPQLTEIVSEKENGFYDLSLDVLLKINFKKSGVLKSYFYTGFRGDYTFKEKIEYAIDANDILYKGSYYWDLDTSWKNERSGYHDFKPLNCSVVGGFGVDYSKKILLEFELDHGLSYLVNNDLLKAKNFMYSVNLGFYLCKIPHFKIVKTEK